MTVVDIAFDPVVQTIEPKVSVSQTIAAPPDPYLVEPVSVIDLEPWTARDGLALYAGAYAADALLETPEVTPSFAAGDVDPMTVTVALNAHVRFLATSAQLGVDGGGRHVLVPQGHTVGGGGYDLALHLKTHVGDDDGTDTVTWDAASPSIDNDYSFRGRGGETVRDVLAFDGEAGLATLFRVSGPGSYPEVTFGIAAVLHPSDWDYYPILESLGDSDSYLQLRYAHGRISVVADHVELVAHETDNGAAQPTVIMLTLSVADDIGRMTVLDESRSSHEFSLRGGVYDGTTYTVGAARTRVFYPHEGYARFGDLELLDLCMWGTALSPPLLEQKLALLAACYGVPL